MPICSSDSDRRAAPYGRVLMSDSSTNSYAIRMGSRTAAHYAQNTLCRFVRKEFDLGHFPWKLSPRRTMDAFVGKTNVARQGLS
jgi:hypothetical protein